MNIRIESQNLRIRMDLEELKNFAKTGSANLIIRFGGDQGHRLCFVVQQNDQFQIRSELTASGFDVLVSVVAEDVMDLLEMSVGPVHKKKLQKSYTCGSDSVFGVNRIDLEVDVFSLKSQLAHGPESTL